MVKKALHLGGGGARGAYQAGVLKAINTILGVKKLPFHMISGVSVGSINAAVLAENSNDFPSAVAKLEELWQNIRCQHIFNASNFELSKSVLRNLSQFIVKQRQSGHLLNTEPFHEFITSNINFELIEHNIRYSELETFEVISTCYETHQSISFYHHKHPHFEDWQYPRHVSQRTNIEMRHIMASSALPLFFPAAKINGFHYGDGCMGLVSPLRGAVRFQVDKVLILGTRQKPIFNEPEKLRNSDIGFANILGTMFNGLFMDNLDRDIEFMNRMNDISRMISMWKKNRSPWRPIKTMHLRPSVDIANIAQSQYKSMPSLLRLLLNVLGAKSHSGDLLSFLLFEKEFTGELLKLGFEDTLAAESEVIQFFSDV